MEETYDGKTVLVVGAARSGIATARFLLARGARVVLTDTKGADSLSASVLLLRDLAPCADRLELELGGHKMESFRNCDLVVVSPGVPLTLPCLEESRRRGIPVLAEVELAYRHLKGRILGITGSNGKTTTTVLVAELLRGAGFRAYAAGNVGTALMSFVEQSQNDDVYSTELSSFQLEGIKDFRPFVAAILNLTPDHMDRYPGFDAYVEAKERIFMNQQPGDFAVLNADDPRTIAMAGRVRSAAVLFSRQRPLARGVFLREDTLVCRDGQEERELFRAADIRLKGSHNLENVLAACAIAHLAGAPPATFREVVRNFKGVEHRLEWVSEIDGVQYFNDSKATNVDAAVKSLEAFPGGIHLIAGGRDKGGDFAVLRPLVAERVKELVLIGEAAAKIREALAGTTEICAAQDLAQALKLCRNRAQAGDVVLLAPACASFDMFLDYEHRGRVFKDLVRAMQKEN
jgi:UDP-N-acetylmuramoylalanine--D-glutamate ligase